MIQTTLRIDEELYEKIIKEAEKDRRSINAEMCFIFEQFIKNRERD